MGESVGAELVSGLMLTNTIWPLGGEDAIEHASDSCRLYCSMIIVRCTESGEKALEDAQMRCPRNSCGQVLQRWGYARRRGVRGLGTNVIEVRPQRVRCRSCNTTQVLLPAALQPRRADTTEVIGTALVSKADGQGYRRIAAALGRPPSTVRRWLRSARGPGHLDWLWQRGAQRLIEFNPDAFNELASITASLERAHTANPLRKALAVLAAAAWWTCQRLGITEPLWPLIGLFAGGRLLAPSG
jgi:hypothetical protein